MNRPPPCLPFLPLGSALQPWRGAGRHEKLSKPQEFKGEWKGWGKYSEPNPKGARQLCRCRKQFQVGGPLQKDQPRHFSGKVVGLGSTAGAMIGLVSMVDVLVDQ